MNDSSPLTPEILSQYEALASNAGWIDCRQRTQIEITGADRASFFHNFCTNDVKALQTGQGCEAFVTSVQGKILGHVCVFCGESSLSVDTVPGQAEALITHLDRYLIREDVQLHDRSSDWSELLVSGPQASDRMRELTSGDLPADRLSHCIARLAGVDVSLHRVDWAGGDGWAISGSRDAMEAVVRSISESGLTACSEQAYNIARLEAGQPLYGVDIGEENLPQEVNRDKLAINFQKGCYLGQETVARIDALGHVNRYLTGIQFQGQTIPAAGCELTSGDKPAGRVTSAVYSPRLAAPLALALVRREHCQAGSKLESELGQAEVISLPLVT